MGAKRKRYIRGILKLSAEIQCDGEGSSSDAVWWGGFIFCCSVVGEGSTAWYSVMGRAQLPDTVWWGGFIFWCSVMVRAQLLMKCDVGKGSISDALLTSTIFQMQFRLLSAPEVQGEKRKEALSLTVSWECPHTTLHSTRTSAGVTPSICQQLPSIQSVTTHRTHVPWICASVRG